MTTRNQAQQDQAKVDAEAAAAEAEAEVQARIDAAVAEALAKRDAEAQAAADAPVELSTTVVVQWPQASVLVDTDADTVRIPNTGRAAEVAGGWVTVRRGDILPVEARPDQRALLLEIGAAAGVVVAAPAAAAPVDGDGAVTEPVI